MLKIGLTGGIGSGKTRVADLFNEWGASVIDTDVIAHELTAPGGAAMPGIRAAFGDAAVTPDGALDRAAMREIVFHDSRARSRLEAIIHPLIAQEALARAARATGCYLVFVVPLLVESKRWLNQVDRVCVVDCDPDTQVARVQQRSGLTADAVRRIMSAQASREARLAVAHDVVLNDGTTTPAQLQQRAWQLHEQWCASGPQVKK
ncbi:MAG: dephospho-CoA kinase [Pusillimonas sp.]